MEAKKIIINENKNLSKAKLLKEILTFKGDLSNQNHTYSSITLISEDDPDKEETGKTLKNIFENKITSSKESRALASLICLAIGDSLGSNSEFDAFSWSHPPKNYQNYSSVQPDRAAVGQWTDDTSMALCLADSLLEKEGEFDGVDIRFRFLLWWHMGYNNGRSPTQTSFGLGGNIAESFIDFQKHPDTAVMKRTEKNKYNNGNGSLMRLASVPIYFHDNEKNGLAFAQNQSYTTHTGDEAAECCRLLTHLIIKLINREENIDEKEILANLKNTFKTEVDCPSVIKLAASEKEENVKEDRFNKSDEDRNWDWKNENWKPSPKRLSANPGYFGSYCMDALALSLYYAYHSKNAKEAILKAVNSGGDSDTVGAITGQIVGAMYGLEPEIIELYEDKNGIRKWDKLAIATAAYKLFHHKKKNWCISE